MTSEAIVFKDPKRGIRFMFPVNPEAILIEDGRAFQEVPIIDLGSVLLSGAVTPEHITFSSFLPRQFDSYCNYRDLEPPLRSWRRLQLWMGETRSHRQVDPTPLRVIVTRSGFSRLMVIDSLSREQRGGEPGDIYFDLSLRAWKSQRIRITERTDQSRKNKKRSSAPKNKTTYTVKRGDTLWAIAKKFYGEGSKWPTIYEANKKVIGSNPNLIYPGQVYVIP